MGESKTATSLRQEKAEDSVIRMGMFEAFGNAKNTVQGKALAVFISLALALSFINVSAFASEGESDHPDAPVVQAESAADKPAANPEAADAVAGAEEPATATELETAPSEKAPQVESGSGGGAITESGSSDASIALELQNASIEYLDQRISLPADRVDYPQSREFRFKAFADQGYELESVAMAVDGFETVLEPDGEGFYAIGAPAVASGLTVKVKAAAAEDFSDAESEDPSATPIDSETVIEPEGNAAASGEVGGRAAEGETVAGEEAVAVIADVSSPAFEGYAYVGNIIVKVTAGEGALPEGATVQASEVEREDVAEAVASEVESRGKQLQDMIAIDVTLLDEDGNAIQPETPVNVCFFDANVEGEEVGVYRVSDDALTVEAIGARQADAAIQSFDVDHFSIYVVGASSASAADSDANSLVSDFPQATLVVGRNYAEGSESISIGSWSHTFSVYGGTNVVSVGAIAKIDGYAFKGAYAGNAEIERLRIQQNGSSSNFNLQYNKNASGNSGWMKVSSLDSLKFVFEANNAIDLSPETVSIAIDDTVAIKAETQPVDTEVAWSSDNEAVATVDNDGVVAAVGFGTATITAETAEGVRATCAVTVADMFTVTFYDADGTALRSDKVGSGGNPGTAPEVTAPEGKVLVGWAYRGQLVADPTIIGIVEDTALYAVYANAHTVTYRYGWTGSHANTSATETVAEGEVPKNVPNANALSADGYVFKGWSTTGDAGQIVTNPGDIAVVGDVVYTAVYEPKNRYTFTLNDGSLNAGGHTHGVTVYYSYNRGELVELPYGATVTVAGGAGSRLMFYVAVNEGHAPQSTYAPVSSNMNGDYFTGLQSAYANYSGFRAATAQAEALGCNYWFTFGQWGSGYYDRWFTIQADPVEFDVRYATEAADEVTNMPTDEAAYSIYDVITLNSQPPMREGHGFSGWKLEETGMVYQPGARVSVADVYESLSGTTLTFVAQWNENAYFVRGNIDNGTAALGGSGVDLESADNATRQQVIYGSSSDPIRLKAKEGYTITSVLVDDEEQTIDAGLTEYEYASQVVTKDVTVNARAEPSKADIVFEENGGSKVADLKGATDEPILNRAMPATVKAGYVFGGWYDNEDLEGNPITMLPESFPAGTTAYYAKWVAAVATVSVWFYGAEPNGEPFFVDTANQIATTGGNKHSKSIDATNAEGYGEEDLKAFSKEAYDLRSLGEEYWYFDLVVHHEGDPGNMWSSFDFAKDKIQDGDDIRYHVVSRAPIAVSYQFVSGTPGKELPAGVIDQLSAARTTTAYKYSTVVNEFSGGAYEPFAVTDPVSGVLQGTWTFEPGWDKDEVVNATSDVSFNGTWTYDVAEYNVTYRWAVGSQTPSGFALPDGAAVGYGQPYEVTDAYERYTAEDPYTDATGSYVFGGWDPSGTITVEGETVVYGTWAYEPADYVVSYEFGGAVPAGHDAPGPDAVKYGQPYEVDRGYYQNMTVSDETGTYTFSGWDKGDFTVSGNETVRGTWTYDVAEYNVTGTIDNGGTVSNASQLIVYGADSEQMVFRAADGYRIVSVTVNGIAQDVHPGMTDYTFDAIEEIDKNYNVDVRTVEMGAVAVVAPSGSKVYDGMTLRASGYVVDGLSEEYALTAEVQGELTNVGSIATTVSNVSILDGDGNDVTENFAISLVEGELSVIPAEVQITVDDATKEAGTEDPEFTGTVEGLVADGDLGIIVYSRTNDTEQTGTYIDAITASFTPNANYVVTVVPGDFTITSSPAPIPLPTPMPTPTPTDTPTPTPAPAATPAPGVLPADDPVAPIAGALADLAETVIGEDETPLAESNIDDDETPLATFDYVHCWVHYYLILGIILTVLYGAGVLIRRIRFTSKLKGYEDDILGIDEGGVAAPSAAPMATEGKEA